MRTHATPREEPGRGAGARAALWYRRMCGRFTLTNPDVEALARELGAALDRELVRLHRPRWNVAPSDRHWVVHLVAGERRMEPAVFGFPGPRGALLVNARAETAHRLATFRHAFREGRCLVPVDGFFEWSGPPGDRHPLWYHARAGGPLLLAGLCQPGPDGAFAFVILTVDANALVREVHDRMPAILDRDAAERWLAEPDPRVLAPAAESLLLARRVSKLVNAVENDGPECLEPEAPSRQTSLL